MARSVGYPVIVKAAAGSGGGGLGQGSPDRYQGSGPSSLKHPLRGRRRRWWRCSRMGRRSGWRRGFWVRCCCGGLVPAETRVLAARSHSAVIASW
ncbi:hypothetical protein ABZ801_20150 [Actinomadura sp. NPDC047616]|uniref:ATP-binding protein n=1 Tax=Actinomadura sp. NPDC047616 TaxID=3155914 RepID=UPI0033E9D283